MKKRKRCYTYRGIWLAVLTLAFTGCGSKESLPTEQELSAKIVEKQEQKQEKKMADAKQTLDHYFNAVAAAVKDLGDKRTAFFEAFSELGEKKLTQAQAQNRAASSIADYEKALQKLQNLEIPPYAEAERFHQELYQTMNAYVPAMKKAEQGLRKQDVAALKEAEKQMAALDAKAQKVLEQTARLQIKINTNG